MCLQITEILPSSKHQRRCPALATGRNPVSEVWHCFSNIWAQILPDKPQSSFRLSRQHTYSCCSDIPASLSASLTASPSSWMETYGTVCPEHGHVCLESLQPSLCSDVLGSPFFSPGIIYIGANAWRDVSTSCCQCLCTTPWPGAAHEALRGKTSPHPSSL